jgi:hypothetical protein
MHVTVKLRDVVASAAVFAIALIAVFVFRAWPVGAAPGDETTFVPITPCRLIDTRTGPDHIGDVTTFGPDHEQRVRLPDDRCTDVGANGLVPSGLELNVTAVGATAPTFITIWPVLPPRPLASSLNPVPGEPPTPNAVTVKLLANQFAVYNLAGSVDLVIDVTGFYTATSLHALQTRLSSLEARVATLERTQPIMLHTGSSGPNTVTDWETVAELEFQRNAQGTLTVNYVAGVVEPDVGEVVRCQLHSSAQTAPVQSFVSTGSSGFLSGTAGFLAGLDMSIRLECSSTNGATVTDAMLTVSFWPWDVG